MSNSRDVINKKKSLSNDGLIDAYMGDEEAWQSPNPRKNKSDLEDSFTVVLNPPFTEQYYDEKRRKREAVFKGVYGVINGIGWGLGITALLTISSISTLGFVHIIILTMSGGLGSIGGLFGGFKFYSQAKELNEREKQLVESINTKINAEQVKQIKLYQKIKEAERLLSIKWESCEDKKEMHAMITAAYSLNRAINNLQFIDVGDKKLPYKEKNGETILIDSKTLNAKLEKQKKACAETCEKILTNPYIKKIIAQEKIIEPEIIQPKPAVEPPSFWSKLTKKATKIGNKMFSAGAGVGLAATIGGLAVTLFLTSNPAGWVVAAILGGIAVSALIMGGISVLIEQYINRDQEKSMAKLGDLYQKVDHFEKAQDRDIEALTKDIRAIHAAEEAKNNQRSLSNERKALAQAQQEIENQKKLLALRSKEHEDTLLMLKVFTNKKEEVLSSPNIVMGEESTEDVLKKQLQAALLEVQEAKQRAQAAEEKLQGKNVANDPDISTKKPRV